MALLSALLVLVALLSESVHCRADPIVSTPLGAVRGLRVEVDTQASVHVFSGIQYASAQRWEPPVPIRPWAPAVYNATAFGASCPGAFGDRQRPVGPGANITSEKCLFLNVWTPSGELIPRPTLTLTRLCILGCGITFRNP